MRLTPEAAEMEGLPLMHDRPRAPSSEPIVIGTAELWTTAAALAHIAAVIFLREFYPQLHAVWLAATELFTRGAAYLFVVIDGHTVAYGNYLSDARIIELRSIYATNRLFALVIVALAIRRSFSHAPAFERQMWNILRLRAKWVFWVGLVLLPAAPVAIYGLFAGFGDVNFFEFELGVILVDRDIYYFLDFACFLIVAWQFLFLIPTATFFAGKVSYANALPVTRRDRRKRGKAKVSAPVE
jgi:hypothetical protein